MSTPYDPPKSPVVDPHGVPFSLSRWLGWFYVSFSGRISRKQFWLFLVVPLVVGGGVFQFLLRYFVHVHMLDVESAKNLWILFWVVAWWPSIAVGVKRWHDLNCSGWWVLIGGVPFVGFLVILVANGLFLEPPEIIASEKTHGAIPINLRRRSRIRRKPRTPVTVVHPISSPKGRR